MRMKRGLQGNEKEDGGGPSSGCDKTLKRSCKQRREKDCEEEGASWECLPQEILLRIFQYLPLLDRAYASQLKERKKPIFVSEKKGCYLCHNTFSEPSVVCLPGGVPIHTQCAAQRVRDSPTKRQLTDGSNLT